MQLALSLVVIALAVLAILYRFEVRLTLLSAALALGLIARKPEVIVQTFLEYLTREQFLLPIGCCMGFAYVLRHTGCDQHLVHLLLKPLQRVRPLLIPGVVTIGALVNVPIISQAGAIVAVGSVLAPVLRAANLSPITIGAALALGASIGGELLNPGAPELGTISKGCGTTATACISRVWPLMLVHLGVTVPLFWLLCLRAERSRTAAVEEVPLPEAFVINPIKAMVPLLPLALLFLTALPPPLKAFDVPHGWLLPNGARPELFDTRLVAAAMLVGVVVAAMTAPAKAGATAKVFFEGAGHALTAVTSIIASATCFGKGVEMAGVPKLLHEVIEAGPGLLVPLAVLMPAGFSWMCGSGMASTQSLFDFFVKPAIGLGVDPVRVGAVVAISAAGGRTLSPVAAVVLLASSMSADKPLERATPMEITRRLAVPLLAGLAAVATVAALLG
jgi:C4-dicarboxylate transporter, DcuC family